MTAEITVNNNDSLTIKYITEEQLKRFEHIFGNLLKDNKNLVNSVNQQYQDIPIPVTINGKKYAYSVYDSKNYGEDLYTIELQMKK